MWATASLRMRVCQQCGRFISSLMRRHRLCHDDRPQATRSRACRPVSARCLRYSSCATLPPPLSFSVELSLPHLPGRTPFATAAGVAGAPASAGTRALHHSTQTPSGTHTAKQDAKTAIEKGRAVLASPGRPAMSTEELIACLLGLPSLCPGAPSRVVQRQWRQFTCLCDSLVRLFLCPSAHGAAATCTSTGPGAPRHSLVGVVMPCKEVYFSARHVDAAAARVAPPSITSSSAGSSSFADEMSTTQAALFLFHQHWRVPVTLTLNTTVPNCTAVEMEGAGGTQPRPHSEHNAAHAAATPDGIDAVVDDFVFAQGGNRLLLVRGDAPPVLRCRLRDGSFDKPLPGTLSTTIAELPSMSRRAHRVFCTGAELIRHVSALRDQQYDQQKKRDGCARARALELYVAGYPQGHPLDRMWGATSAARSVSAGVAATGAAVAPGSSVSAPRHRSLEFLRAFESEFEAAEHAFATAVRIAKSGARVTSVEKRSSGTGVSDGAPFVASAGSRECARHPCAPHAVMPELKELCRTLGRLGAVRRLWTCSSSYDPDVRAACIHRMLHEKVLLRSPGEPQHRRVEGGSCHDDAGAPVIVTQMITTEREFTDYVEDIKRGLRAWGATATSGGKPESDVGVRTGGGHHQRHPPHAAARDSLTPISVIPGVLLPHPTNVHVLLRSLYYTKVIPSARMQRALEAYASELRSAWWQLAGEHPRRKRESALQGNALSKVFADSDVSAAILEVGEDRVAQVEARVRQVRRGASCRFASAWLSETVDLLHELHRIGQTRVHFFTVCNDKVDLRVEQLLVAYDARRGVPE
ncbi:hypothetical protein GH5_06947 [Leishmania sp. Ghana 2012 LV757]|uniref:hypothetical protein n=1 Tax=Leishmania sp. Ghana 2012 LV757 TaxID=2803181 RepID=UPI001B4130D5|nr:hypothetical protein GH5_06947 [Leishmania sp. Ghana 2012 LV757]